ncbi:GNAT family N-acetyltransferase [Patescibacteria group bacterium]|nr:GNAT family N-acetyltransferase [Patescibacteria group bacterium]MBU1868702.1 GNAT family N-acetyltransferase [Patescibacteria group bacterium]
MITFRKATTNDLQALKELNKRIFVNNPKYDDDAVEDFAHTPRGEKYFKEAIISKKGHFIIAEENGQMVGYANGGEKGNSNRKSKYFEIDNLGVIPEKKRQGVGTKILSAITNWAKKEGYQRIYLNCYAKNEEALDFYRCAGYSEIDICLEKIISE